MKGTVKFYVPLRGYGFIVPEIDTGSPEPRDIWFCRQHLPHPSDFPAEGQPVEYELAPSPIAGKKRAQRVWPR
jgi:cold shock CspA family protein